MKVKAEIFFDFLKQYLSVSFYHTDNYSVCASTPMYDEIYNSNRIKEKLIKEIKNLLNIPTNYKESINYDSNIIIELSEEEQFYLSLKYDESFKFIKENDEN